jgi:hypothetical protein
MDDPIEAALVEMEELGNCQCSDQLCEHTIDAVNCRLYLISALRVADKYIRNRAANDILQGKPVDPFTVATLDGILAALRGEVR